jgi:oligopeptide/dipeptide ABC transporter ATP-binding protein
VSEALLEVRNLVKHFPVRQGVFRPPGARRIRAVDGVSFSIRPGRTLGLVGESGSGKTTVGRAIMRFLDVSSGEIRFNGVDVSVLRGRALKSFRRGVQIVFQNPAASLDPRMTVGEIVAEPLRIHRVGDRAAQTAHVRELLMTVGLSPEDLSRYPHEFSGGQQQRIGIARALALKPRLVVCDEPVSALDVCVQAQVLNLLGRLQRDFGLAYLCISHDLSLVRHISDEVAVMYLGKIVEMATAERLFEQPNHPYTQALLSAAMPSPGSCAKQTRRRILLSGEPPSAADPPTGCRLHPRCPIAKMPLCAAEEPPLRKVALGHVAACHFARPLPIPVDENESLAV